MYSSREEYTDLLHSRLLASWRGWVHTWGWPQAKSEIRNRDEKTEAIGPQINWAVSLHLGFRVWLAWGRLGLNLYLFDSSGQGGIHDTVMIQFEERDWLLGAAHLWKTNR